MSTVNLWEFIAGLGIFLYGMTQIEKSLNKFAGNRLSVFLREQTQNPIKAVFGGTIATALLQSSSVVSLMVLAFVGAGIIEMRNALGVIFGANLGTTLTGWIVATIGFKLDIEALALPLVGLGSLGILAIPKKRNSHHLFLAGLGLGLILLGLGYMKGSLESLSTQFDISVLKGHSLFVYLLVGIVFTAVIQSSSATMMIALSALNATLIDVHSAAALVIGANLGTTSTVMLGSIKGSAAKKQVALAHFLFNVVADLLALALLGVLLSLLVDQFGITDPLYTLVAFHSTFNLIGIVLFLPFINIFARFLEKRFVVEPGKVSRYIGSVPPRVSVAAMTALENETRALVSGVFNLNRRCLKIDVPHTLLVPPSNNGALPAEPPQKFNEQYGSIKTLEGEILNYAVAVQKHSPAPESISRLNSLLSCVRDSVVSAKALKDIRHNLVEFRHSVEAPIQQYEQFLSAFMQTFYNRLKNLWDEQNHALRIDLLSQMIVDNNQFHDDFIKRIYADAKLDLIDERMLSTLLNVNRELYTSNHNLLNACQHLLLEPHEREDLSNLYLSR